MIRIYFNPFKWPWGLSDLKQNTRADNSYDRPILFYLLDGMTLNTDAARSRHKCQVVYRAWAKMSDFWEIWFNMTLSIEWSDSVVPRSLILVSCTVDLGFDGRLTHAHLEVEDTKAGEAERIKRVSAHDGGLRTRASKSPHTKWCAPEDTLNTLPWSFGLYNIIKDFKQALQRQAELAQSGEGKGKSLKKAHMWLQTHTASSESLSLRKSLRSGACAPARRHVMIHTHARSHPRSHTLCKLETVTAERKSKHNLVSIIYCVFDI